jgi:hypothetical protein
MRGYLGPSMLRNRHRNAPRPAWKVEESFRKWLRGRPCFLARHPLGGCGLVPGRKPVESAHVDHGGDKGAGTKASDRFCIPLCPAHHDEQGGKTGPFRLRGGWPTFEAKYGFNALQIADEYWRLWKGDKGVLADA